MKNRKWCAALAVLGSAAIVVLASSAWGQGSPGGEGQGYIVLMEPAPALRYEGDQPGFEATRPGKGKKINPRSAHVRSYREHLVSSHGASLAAAGAPESAKVHDYTVALNGYSAVLTAEQASAIATQPGVVAVRPDELRFKQTDSSPDFLGLTAPAGPWSRGFDGEGVVVGMIDTGIWPEHPSFQDDGSYDAPPLTLEDTPSNPSCNFGNMVHNPNDVPFTCNNKLIGARQMMAMYKFTIGLQPDEYDSARDDNGHGTGTASITAGNEGVLASILGIPRGVVSGIAPRAHLVAYRAGGNAAFLSDLAAAIDQAVADGVDVIQYGYGGGPSLSEPDDIAMLFAADAGVFVAVSAGNSGPSAGTVGSSAPWITSTGASTQQRFFGGAASSSDGWLFPGASITPGTDELPLVDAASAGGDLCAPWSLNTSMVAGKIVLCRRGSYARVEKSRAVLIAGGAGTILYNSSDPDELFPDTHWVPTVHVDNTAGLAIKAYIASDPSPTARIVAQSGSGPIAGGPGSPLDLAPRMARYSSRGPNPAAEEIIKPDVTAPGLQILCGESPTPDSIFMPGQYFKVVSGSSLAAAHVAGVLALLKQAYPDWSPAMAKSALMTTAHQDVLDTDRVSPADPFDMGAGHIDPGDWSKGSFAQPGLVYDAGFLEYLGFLCDADPSVFADPVGTCDFLASIGVPTTARDLNLASIAVSDLSGSQTIQRTVTSVVSPKGNTTFGVSVDAPPGFDVTVSPSTFKLKTGDTVTYHVTLTDNGSGTPGQWSFGSLTWSDKTGNYEVRSPIAVRAP